MKRIHIGIVVVVVVLLAAAGVAGARQNMRKNAAEAALAQEEAGCAVKVLGTAVGQEYQKKPMLIVVYEFVHYGGKPRSFTMSVDDKAIQNGVECSSFVLSEDIDDQQQLNDVEPNVPYVLKVGYLLQDTTAPVELEITNQLLGEEVLRQTVNLQ